MVDPQLGFEIFPHTLPEKTDSNLFLSALNKFSWITDTNGILSILNHRINVGNTSSYVISYIYKASGRFHEAVLKKMLNSFFSGLPSDNPISCSACESPARVQQYARQFYSARDYFRLP